MAPERYGKWLDALPARPAIHVYPDRDAFARRLLRDNRFLSPERAAFLAEHLALGSPGGVVWNGDPWHKAPAYLFRLEESMAVWRQVTAPVLWVAGRQSWIMKNSPAARRLGSAARLLRQPGEAWIGGPTTCCTTTSRRPWPQIEGFHDLSKVLPGAEPPLQVALGGNRRLVEHGFMQCGQPRQISIAFEVGVARQRHAALAAADNSPAPQMQILAAISKPSVYSKMILGRRRAFRRGWA